MGTNIIKLTIYEQSMIVKNLFLLENNKKE